MIVGCVKEIKRQEYRVGLTPINAKEYIAHGHTVLVEGGAGVNAGYTDAAYEAAGAQIVSANDVWAKAGMVVKVKEPLEPEYGKMRPGQVLYTYLHLAADAVLTQAMLDSGCTGVAYETVRDAKGRLPLLRPMSEVAGRLSVQEGAKCLEQPEGGRGVLLGGVPGVPGAKVLVLGVGTVGMNAVKVAAGMGADVTVADRDIDRLAYLDDLFASRVHTLHSSGAAIEEVLPVTDLVIGAVLVPGAATPKLLRKEHLKLMQPGSVIVDVAVDQGGCCETSHPTYHDAPTFVVDGVVHYCVGNMPGAVPLTSTKALTGATLAYGLAIADGGIAAAARKDAGLAQGINCMAGKLTCAEVAKAHGMAHTPLERVLGD